MQRISIVRPVGADYSVATKLVNPEHVDKERRSAAELAPEGDIFVIPEPLSRIAPKLVVMDVDSTFLNEEVIELIAEHAGVRDEVAAVTDRAMRGELDFAASLRERVAALAGLPSSVLDEVREAVTLTAGVEAFVASVQEAGGVVGLVSGGFAEVVVPIAARLGIDEVLANRLEVVDGRLTGRVDGPIVDRAAKAAQLESLCGKYGVDIRYTVAIGDGANDADMITAAGFGVAFCAKPALVEVADASLTVRRMDAVWAAITGHTAKVVSGSS
ncbi:hypothetical protein GCM10022261_30290 [Brevibacterium daeguense]|uniref:phosphoserine phosphatase n=1 Tax=Brevibacterium daeguense TaxID=909936 RepID=A0ABP8ENC5_9MICO|nr:phosphoserine phosphatase SerB [Brevibacterium daeguense]